jgi:hypothetical protein
MAFVKVIEGSKIYNFHIHHLMHFSTKFWSKSCSNRGSAKSRRAGHALCRDVAPRRRARAPPDAPTPDVTCHPRPTHLLQAGAAPQDASVCPAPRASLSPPRTRAVHAADRRSVRSQTVRAPAEERRSTMASRPSSSCRHRRSSTRPIKGAIAFPRAGTEPPAPLPPS